MSNVEWTINAKKCDWDVKQTFYSQHRTLLLFHWLQKISKVYHCDGYVMLNLEKNEIECETIFLIKTASMIKIKPLGKRREKGIGERENSERKRKRGKEREKEKRIDIPKSKNERDKKREGDKEREKQLE